MLALINLTFVSAAIPSVYIDSPEKYNVYSANGIMCSATVYNNSYSPSISFNGTYLGNMSQAGSNAYYYNWHPTSSQRGLGIQALEPLKVTAVGSDGSRNAILSKSC